MDILSRGARPFPLSRVSTRHHPLPSLHHVRSQVVSRLSKGSGILRNVDVKKKKKNEKDNEREERDALNCKLQFTCRLRESIKRDTAESIERFRDIVMLSKVSTVDFFSDPSRHLTSRLIRCISIECNLRIVCEEL